MTFQEKYAKMYEKSQKGFLHSLQANIEACANTIFEVACEAIDETLNRIYSIRGLQDFEEVYKNLNRLYSLEGIQNFEEDYLNGEFSFEITFSENYVYVADKCIEVHSVLYCHRNEMVKILASKFASVGVYLYSTDNADAFSAHLKFDSNDNNTDS